ncbi:MAG: hypothetical protein DRN12_07530, partial [Thermoplasmata archaeon]
MRERLIIVSVAIALLILPAFYLSAQYSEEDTKYFESVFDNLNTKMERLQNKIEELEKLLQDNFHIMLENQEIIKRDVRRVIS